MIISSLFYLICVALYIEIGMNRGKRKAAELYIIMLVFFLAFFHKPLATDDLTREYAKLAGIKSAGWSYFSSMSSFQESTTLGRITSNGFEGLYVTQLIYYAFSRLPIFNFLPAVVTSVQFYLGFKIFNKTCKRFDVSYRQEIIIFLSILFVRELRWMISGIRNQLAFTIAIYVLYKDLEEKKNIIICMIAYILCGMIHQSAYVVVALRLLLLIPFDRLKAIIAVLLLLWSNMLSYGVSILAKYINIPIINSILWKITIYTDNAENNINVVLRSYYVMAMISNVLLLVATGVSAIIYIKYLKNNDQYHSSGIVKLIDCKKHMSSVSSYLSSDMAWFIIFATCLTVGSYKYYWLYLRFAIIVQLLLPLIAASVFTFKGAYRRDLTQERLLISTAIIVKFVITVLIVNRSFDFSLFAIYG